MPDYRTIITTTGQAKLAAAILGPALVIQKMAVGDAGGVGYDPAEAQIALVGQVHEADLDGVETLAGGVIVCEMTIPADQGGWHVREAAIKDDTGDIIAIARIADRYKPLPASGQADELTIRMKLDVGNVGNVNWVVDLSRKSRIDGQLRPDFRSAEAIQNDPAGAPVAGETWIVGAAPTGAWVGHENELAEWSGSGWSFALPTAWMHVGLADRTDWRWDHTLGVPAWVLWEAGETVAGPVSLASIAAANSGAALAAVTTAKSQVYPASVPNSLVTITAISSFEDDGQGDWEQVGNKLVCQRAGRYMIFGSLSANALGVGTAALTVGVRYNGVEFFSTSIVLTASSAIQLFGGAAEIHDFAVDDELQFSAYQTSGATRNLNINSKLSTYRLTSA